MLCSLVLFVVTVIANPFPLSDDSTDLNLAKNNLLDDPENFQPPNGPEDDVQLDGQENFEQSSIPANSPNDKCTSDVPMDGFDSNGIYRREAGKICPPTGAQTDTAPALENPPSSGKTKEPNKACKKYKEKFYLLYCGGPEFVLGDSVGEDILEVVNCIESKSTNLLSVGQILNDQSFLDPVSRAIPQRGLFKPAKLFGKYCCDVFYDTVCRILEFN